MPGRLRAITMSDDGSRATHQVDLTTVRAWSGSGGFPAVGPKVMVSSGEVDGEAWTLAVYRDRRKDICLQLQAGKGFNSWHCVPSPLDTFRVFSGSDLVHASTFVYGVTATKVAWFHLVLQGTEVNLPLVEVPSKLRTGGYIFATRLPEYMLQLDDRDQGRRVGYAISTGKAIAYDAGGSVLAEAPLIFGRPGG
jgi:hypothetical protein